MTLKYKLDLAILEVFLHVKTEVFRLILLKVRARIGQRERERQRHREAHRDRCDGMHYRPQLQVATT